LQTKRVRPSGPGKAAAPSASDGAINPSVIFLPATETIV
jgi:hypothetical protein